jgi:hypothetical protein
MPQASGDATGLSLADAEREDIASAANAGSPGPRVPPSIWARLVTQRISRFWIQISMPTLFSVGVMGATDPEE